MSPFDEIRAQLVSTREAVLAAMTLTLDSQMELEKAANRFDALYAGTSRGDRLPRRRIAAMRRALHRAHDMGQTLVDGLNDDIMMLGE